MNTIARYSIGNHAIVYHEIDFDYTKKDIEMALLKNHEEAKPDQNSAKKVEENTQVVEKEKTENSSFNEALPKANGTHAT